MKLLGTIVFITLFTTCGNAQKLNKKFLTQNIWQCVSEEVTNYEVLDEKNLILLLVGVNNKTKYNNENYEQGRWEFLFKPDRSFVIYYIDWKASKKNKPGEKPKYIHIAHEANDFKWSINKKSNSIVINEKDGIERNFKVSGTSTKLKLEITNPN
ncbi:MAG: hypothetical protein ACI9J3_004169 [Parvicellaceae bacterium]|jgi:hypothetical protein